MARTAAPDNPPCPGCGHPQTVRNGRTRGRQRWVCAGCDHSFGPTTGTPMYRLQTPPAEVARALLVVLRRGSLLAAEEVTGHKYETSGRWLRRAAAHAEVLTDALVHDLQLTEVEVDEFWSFVQHKGGQPKRPPPRRPLATSTPRTPVSAGAA
jgi:transposase-like protein